jgi:hypothetical protein
MIHNAKQEKIFPLSLSNLHAGRGNGSGVAGRESRTIFAFRGHEIPSKSRKNGKETSDRL